MTVAEKTNQLSKVIVPLGDVISLLKPSELHGRYRVALGTKTLTALATGSEIHLARLPILSYLGLTSYVKSSVAQTATCQVWVRLAPSTTGEAFTAAEVNASEGGVNILIGSIPALGANALVPIAWSIFGKTLAQVIAESFGAPIERADRRFSRVQVDLVAVTATAALAVGDLTVEIPYVVD